MLPIAVIEEIDRLLKSGKLSQRKIAKRLCVSRGVVGAIATGRRGIYGHQPASERSDSLTPLSRPERCPRCGFNVYMPCLVCRARDHRQQQRMLQIASAAVRRTRAARSARCSSAARSETLQHARVA